VAEQRGGTGSNAHVVKVPDIGEGIAEVELVAWQVKPGDAVEADQPLADLMTDKATVEVPSPVSGTVLSLGGKPGDKLAVGSELLRLATQSAGRDEPVAGAAPSAAPVVTHPAPDHPVRSAASPSVRRHARELGIDLASVRGSGPEGRVVHDDLVRHASRPANVPAMAARYAERGGEEKVPVIGLRRQIALRMQDAAARVPHFTYVEEVDVTELEALRARLNAERGAARGHLTVLPFLMRAIALAVSAFPGMNARFDDEAGVVTRHGAVHIGIATQTDGGLMVPVVRHAEAKDLWSAAAEIGRLAQAARAGRATREELSGSTITITSLGPLGGIVTTPIINPPEVAIVGVNRIVERPAMRGGLVVPRLAMNLSCSFDHRVVDGQQAAEFVQALRGYLECPAMLFVDG
jgi:2-oxoisovalerate dehydrogenase E2 component (dihydrolipoyl transacylase)